MCQTLLKACKECERMFCRDGCRKGLCDDCGLCEYGGCCEPVSCRSCKSTWCKSLLEACPKCDRYFCVDGCKRLSSIRPTFKAQGLCSICGVCKYGECCEELDCDSCKESKCSSLLQVCGECDGSFCLDCCDKSLCPDCKLCCCKKQACVSCKGTVCEPYDLLIDCSDCGKKNCQNCICKCGGCSKRCGDCCADGWCLVNPE